MQHSNRLFQRLSLGMVVLLMGLLSIGPFLHSHVGASVESGFHMDGVRSLAPITIGSTHASAALPNFNVNNDESPALGVAISLPKSDQESLCVGNLNTVLAAVLLASLVCTPQRMHHAWPSANPTRTYQAGWPPPALAPPLNF